MLKRILLATILAFSFAVPAPQPAFAGKVAKSIVAYKVAKTAVRTKKMVSTTRAYVRQLERLGGKLNKRQIAELKNCARDPGCVTWLRNPQTFAGKPRKDAVAMWERQTGRTWPRYQSDTFAKNGQRVGKAGEQYDAHHIVPKGQGGPHEWWNMHPIPRPEHMDAVHSARGFLNVITRMNKP